MYFEVDPVIVCVLHEIVFVDEFLRNVGELDFDVLGPVEGSAEIEVGDIGGAELSSLSGENAVDQEFDQFEWCHFGVNLARVTDAGAGYGDVSSSWVRFFGADFADNIAVEDFCETIRWYVREVDDVEGIGAVN